MDWWHDDPEFFNATLSMLTTGEDEPQVVPVMETTAIPLPPPSFVTSLSSSDESPAITKTTKPRPKVTNPSRERRRDEMRYLRAKVADLEAQLAILQQRREEMLRPHRSENGEIRSIAAVWEAMATRQVKELKRSQVVNAKLKQMLENQLHVASDLLTAIRTAEEESQRQREEADGIVSIMRPRLAIDISQKISEEDQLARLDVLCTQIREAFAASPKFSNGTVRFLDIQLVEDNGIDAIVDVFSCSAMPFPTATVEDVFWRFFLDECIEEDDGSFRQDYESRNDTIIGVFHAVSTIDNHRTTFDGKYVGKRLRCPNGHMIVASHVYSEPKCKSNLLEDVALHEDAWMRIVASKDVGGPELSHPLTLLQESRRMYIHFGLRNNGSTVEPRRAGALTEFLMLQTEDQIKRSEQCIENMLLNELGKLSLTTPLEETSIIV